MKIVQQTFPTTLPVELESIKSQLRIDGTDEDILISNRVKSAQSFIEQYTNRCLLSSTFIAYLDSYPETELWIYKFPITAITAVKYYNSRNFNHNDQRNGLCLFYKDALQRLNF